MSQDAINWPIVPPTWDAASISLLKEGSTDLAQTQNISESILNIITKSDNFPLKFPIDSIRCKTLSSSVSENTLERNINSAYPLIHEHGLYLCAKFLLHKRQNGSIIEKKFYQNMSVIDLIDRLLNKRAAVFVGRFDYWQLMDGTKGAGKWETIGNNETSPLILKDYISYDEIKISALLSVSSYSYFTNIGNRRNNGKVEQNRDYIQNDGVVVGLIGTRLKRENVMEYQEIVISETQNIPEIYNDKKTTIPSIFADFYQEPCFNYKRVKTMNNTRFTKIQKDDYFDNILYAKRLSLSFDTLLIEANSRSAVAKMFAYVHVVGIGLGVWRASNHQENVFVETFLQRIKTLGDNLHHVSDIDFSYMGDKIQVENYFDGSFIQIQDHPKGGIKIHVSKREPYTKIEDGKLLVVSYAWDGNSLPGNEFWQGKLGSTSDSATASSSQVTELHNPHINGNVCGRNLRVVTLNGLVSIQDYINKLNTKKCNVI